MAGAVERAMRGSVASGRFETSNAAAPLPSVVMGTVSPKWISGKHTANIRHTRAHQADTLIVLVALFLPALLLGGLVALVFLHRPELDPASGRAASAAAHGLERRLDEERGVITWVQRRLDPKTATGLALVAGLAVITVGGLVVGGLAYLVRAHAGLQGLDDSVAPWGAAHATAFTHDIVDAVTQLGSTRVLVIVVAITASSSRSDVRAGGSPCSS